MGQVKVDKGRLLTVRLLFTVFLAGQLSLALEAWSNQQERDDGFCTDLSMIFLTRAESVLGKLLIRVVFLFLSGYCMDIPSNS